MDEQVEHLMVWADDFIRYYKILSLVNAQIIEKKVLHTIFSFLPIPDRRII